LIRGHFQAALDQAKAKKDQDAALLVAAEKTGPVPDARAQEHQSQQIVRPAASKWIS